MFRKMRRFKQELNETECKKILKNEVRGVLSVIGDDGYPYGLPIDYWYDEIENRIYFHGAKEGHKLDAIKKCNKVSFCTYDKGYRKDGEWPLYINSVIVFGKISIVNDNEKKLKFVKISAINSPMTKIMSPMSLKKQETAYAASNLFPNTSAANLSKKVN